MPIGVRPATTVDVPAIRAVASRTWRATYAELLPASDIEAFLATAYAPEGLARGIERRGDGYLVAVDGETVVGYAIAGRNCEGDGELFAIYVAPEAQGRGVGHALWQRAVAHLRAIGCAELGLWVAAGNAAARRFYERQGAEPVAERVDRIGDGELREVRYRIRLIEPPNGE